MSSSFNLNTFLKEYQSYGNRQYTAIENGKAAMEQHEIDMAKEAISENRFLSLTLAEKFAELGIGDRVVQQMGDTAVKAIKEIVNPFTEYLEKYDVVLDQDKYNQKINEYGKQLFFSKQALAQESRSRSYGQRFVYDM